MCIPERLSLFLCAAVCGWGAPLTLEQAVRQSLERYPAVRVSLEQVSAAAAGIRLARTSYLPRVDTLAQVNRATRNNIYGMLLPQATLPGISGPPLPANAGTNVWGTAIGFLVSWEPFDFGLRQANVDAAEASRKRAEAGLARTKFETSAQAADSFLTILAARQTVRAAEAAVARSRVLEETVGALVKAGLRPGVDAERARAEKALAETQLVHAEEAVALASASLAQLLGVRPAEITAEAGKLLELPPGADEESAGVKDHPLAREQTTAIDEVEARRRSLDKTWYPRFNLQGSTYARGTGANPDFTTGGAASGLGPNIYNWGLGFTVTFPLLEQPGIKAKQEIESYRARAESAKYDQVVRDLQGRLEKANAMAAAARRVARLTPVQLEAARAAETQAMARYKAGLGTLVEVAETQRLLAQAEIDDSLARLNVWRALLARAAAEGDLEPFLGRAR